MATTTAEVYENTLAQRVLAAPREFVSRAWGWARSNPVTGFARRSGGWLRRAAERGRGYLSRAWRFATRYVPAPLMAAKYVTSPTLVSLTIQGARAAATAASVGAMYAVEIVTWPLSLTSPTARLRHTIRRQFNVAAITALSGFERALRWPASLYARASRSLAFRMAGHVTTGAIVASAATVATGITPIGWALGALVTFFTAQDDLRSSRLLAAGNSWWETVTLDLSAAKDYLKTEDLTKAEVDEAVALLSREPLLTIADIFPESTSLIGSAERTGDRELTMAGVGADAGVPSAESLAHTPPRTPPSTGGGKQHGTSKRHGGRPQGSR